jgi:hypothetical protein
METENNKDWHAQQEKILKKWAEVSSSYRYLHDRSYTLYNSRNLYFALPVIILSTITGTANFAQSSFPDSIKPYAPSFIGTLNLAAGLITTIAQFLRVSELLESHKVASLAFGKLSRNIAVELSLPVSERTTTGTAFLSTCRVELDKLIEQSPNIPLTILSSFDKKFKGSDFIKPDILEITGVEVYQNNELEDKKFKDELLKLEKEKRNSIIKEEEERKLQAYNEIKKLKKQTKKKELSTMSVHKSLDKLLSSFNSPPKEEEMLVFDNNVTSSDSSDSTDYIKRVDYVEDLSLDVKKDSILDVKEDIVLDVKEDIVLDVKEDIILDVKEKNDKDDDNKE